MGGEEQKFVKEAFDSNYIAPLGPQVDLFEKEFAEKFGSPMRWPYPVERPPCIWPCGEWALSRAMRYWPQP
jgi:hypothetical protein